MQVACFAAPDPALTPFTVEDANVAQASVRLRSAAQPAFRNHYGNVQGGFAVAMADVLAVHAIAIAAMPGNR